MKVSWNPPQPLDNLDKSERPAPGEEGVYLLLNGGHPIYAGAGDLRNELQRLVESEKADNPDLRDYLSKKQKSINYCYFLEKNQLRREGARAFILLLKEKLGLLNAEQSSANPIYVNPPVQPCQDDGNCPLTWELLFKEKARW